LLCSVVLVFAFNAAYAAQRVVVAEMTTSET
jgi:hypothetical protein